MITKMTHTTLLVGDYDQAIKWYTKNLGLEPRMDSPFYEGYRFVTVGAKGQDVELVLHRPVEGQNSSGPAQGDSSIHGFVLEPDDCRKEIENLRRRGVKLTQEPEDVLWGVQAVIEDLYENTHAIVEP